MKRVGVGIVELTGTSDDRHRSVMPWPWIDTEVVDRADVVCDLCDALHAAAATTAASSMATNRTLERVQGLAGSCCGGQVCAERRSADGCSQIDAGSGIMSVLLRVEEASPRL